ncbi:iron-sulfur cluster assembly scaffold protein [Elstera litoralis]|uniref:iron-sulfur cluster assembly scaffold protein n=1 Tax=Elstera litoralis TaxID=552518 RepID=UPI0006972461|nr:iron-sulfur cluster assembly scaffold protein [Elstera litoralis]
MGEALYSDAIVALAARKLSRLPEPDVSAVRNNPLCGDRVTLDLTVAEGIVTAAGGDARGCALCCAGLAALLDDLPGRKLADLPAQIETARRLVASGVSEPESAFAAMLDRPIPRPRQKCVLLPVEALKEALSSLSTNTQEYRA